MIDNLIIFRCPQTGTDVQTLLRMQEHDGVVRVGRTSVVI